MVSDSNDQPAPPPTDPGRPGASPQRAAGPRSPRLEGQSRVDSRPGLPPATRSFLTTWPGRLLVGGAAIRLCAWLLRAAGVHVAVFDAIGTLGSIAAIAGLVYLAYKGVIHGTRRLLWRVRRKLIVSYIFVGVVPVLLLVAFFLLSLLLVFFNVSSYLVARSIRSVSDDAKFLAETTATDLAKVGLREADAILEQRQRTIAQRYPNASVSLVPTLPEPCGGSVLTSGRDQTDEDASQPGEPATPAGPGRTTPIAVGPWTHLEPPKVLPSWVSCSGFGGLIAVELPGASTGAAGTRPIGLVIRAAALPEAARRTFAIVVDIPLDGSLASAIHDQTSVKLGQISSVPYNDPGIRPVVDRAPNASALLLKSEANASGKRRIPWVALLEWVDWKTGLTETATVNIDVNIADIYDRLSAAQGRMGAYNLWTAFLALLVVLAFLFFIIEIVALIMGLILAKSITGSVHQLFTGTERVRRGDFTHKIAVKARDQLGELAESFNSMTASIEDLLRQAEEKKRLEEELRIARAIQMSLLPRGQLAMPGVSITAMCVPAREVGGDYYDLLPLDGGRLGVLVADVAGKGTSAALYMAELKGVILSLSRIHQSPRQLLIEANRIIASNLDSRSFITMTYAVVDVQARTMTYARAGHTPLIYRPGNGDGSAPAEVKVLVPDGLVLGLQMGDGGALFERLLKEDTIAFRPGDLFVFFTDGVTEAMNDRSDCFGEGRLGEILGEHGDLPSEELRERILREISAFVGSAPQHDDMTMILLRIEAAAAGAVQGVGAVLAAQAAVTPLPRLRSE